MDLRHDKRPKLLRTKETLPTQRGATSDHRCHDVPTYTTPQNHKLVLGRPSSYSLVGGQI